MSGRPFLLLGVSQTGTRCVMTQIILEENDRLEWALKTFRRKVQRSGVLRELRNKRYYMKPSTARRLKAAAAVRRRNRVRRQSG